MFYIQRMSGADEYLFKETVNPVDQVDPMLDKKMFYVLDQNGGSFNGQIQFDTSVLANSGQYLGYSEAYFEIPFVVTMTTNATLDVAAAPGPNSFMAGLKNGYHQLIDSIQVDWNNSSVISLQPFTNFFVSYKLMTSMSADDVKKWGPSIGFSPDTAGSFSYSGTPSANGNGFCNNNVNPIAASVYGGTTTTAAPYNLDTYNAGFAQRLKSTSFVPTVAGAQTTPNGLGVLSIENAGTIGKNVCRSNEVSAANRVWQWTILATIRLKDLSDLFDKIPLVKGAFMRITLNYNSSTTVVTGAVGGQSFTSVVMNSGRTNPILVSSSAAGNPNATVGVVAANRTFSCGVVNTASRFATPPLTSCRLYVPAYSLNPIYESELLTVKPYREIKYLDIYNYNITGTASGSPFNAILTNGIVNPKYVVIIPMANTTAQNIYASNSAPVYQSPFDTAPATSTPMAAISQFQVQVSGQNVFQQNFQYDWEAFLNEVSSINSINGGLSTGLTSGLIGSYEWDNGYRYYVADISRRLPSEDSIPKSVVISGTNATLLAMDYYCFIVYEKTLRVDMRTGGLVQ